jgi:hypothetical protein
LNDGLPEQMTQQTDESRNLKRNVPGRNFHPANEFGNCADPSPIPVLMISGGILISHTLLRCV